MPRLVFEIGSEEIPPRFLIGAVEQLKSQAQERLRDMRLECGSIKSYATPRRLALVVEDLANKQESRLREEQGPPANRAFDEQGAPNKAAVGFAARWGVKPEDLQVKPTPRGDYLFAVFEEKGRPAIEVLKEVLPALAGALYFPKTMRWGSGTFRFGRPVRWLLALLDKRVIKFGIDGLESGRESRGHPILYPKKLKVADAADYESCLRKAKVMIDQEERGCLLVRQLQEIARQQKARLADADELILETIYSLEWPTSVCGSFDSRYLKLPRPVLMEEMRKVQGFFPLENGKGRLIGHFIGVRDGGSVGLDIVRSGYEGVLRAKFEDATFFFEHDRRKTLESRVEELKEVVFLEGLGSLYDKTLRVQELVGWLADSLDIDDKTKAAAQRAAQLAKTDLVTDLVIDITSLQGVMGSEYALADGEPPEVAQAIGEHYKPRGIGDALPKSTAGLLVALADKVDMVVSGFAAGLSVSGSQDPYGLRREGQAIVSLIVEKQLALSVTEMIEKAMKELSAQQKTKRKSEEVRQMACALLRQRLERLLEDTPPAGKAIRYDLVDAVLAAGEDDLSDAAVRANTLQELYNRDTFMPTVIASTRPANIVKDFPGGEPEATLFEEETEQQLWEACQRVRPQVEELAEKCEYTVLFDLLAGLCPLIDRFFDDVLVMAQDERVRNNRLALVWQVDRLFRYLADFRLVVQEGENQNNQ